MKKSVTNTSIGTIGKFLELAYTIDKMQLEQLKETKKFLNLDVTTHNVALFKEHLDHLNQIKQKANND